MKNNYKVFLIVFFIFVVSFIVIFSQSYKKNLAYKKQVIGNIPNLKVLTDGVIKIKNYIEVKDFAKEPYFIIVLGQAKYINGIKFYWVKGFEPLTVRIETSKSLFKWQNIQLISYLKFKEEKDFLVSEHTLKNIACFFVKVTILRPKNKSVKLSEVELFSNPTLKLKITSQKVINIKKHSAEVVFKTSIPSTGYLRFGLSPNNLTKNVGIEIDIYSTHKIKLSDLLQGTKYYYQPVARDLNNNIAVGKISSFQTKGIPLPKFSKVDVFDVKKFSAKIKWIMNVPCKSTLLLGTSVNDLKEYYNSKNFKKENIVKINKLVPDREFYFKIFSVDKFNNKIGTHGIFKTLSDNIAFGKKVYGNFFYYPRKYRSDFNFGILKRITDGNYEVNGIAKSGNITKSSQSVIVDLGREFKIDKIHVIWRGIAYSRKFNVYLSSDMKRWEKIKKNLDAKKDGIRISSQKTYGLFLRLVEIKLKGKIARYIKILVPKNSEVGSDIPFPPGDFLQLAEVEVFKVPDYGEPQFIIEKIK